MNIFVLDRNPIIAAQFLCDQHIRKMGIESAQMLSTAHWLAWEQILEAPKGALRERQAWLRRNVPENAQPPYSIALPNHPCTVWVREAKPNYRWLLLHAIEIQRINENMYNRPHKTSEVVNWLRRLPPNTMRQSIRITEFPLCMPDDCKIIGDPVLSYRLFYAQHKKFASWTTRTRPKWLECANYPAKTV